MLRLNLSHESTGDAMYTHPEISLLGSAQRIRDMHGRADVDRQIAQARQAPLPSSLSPGNYGSGLGSPAVPVWLIAPCSWYGLGGVAPGAVGA